MSYLKSHGQVWVPEEGCLEDPPSSLRNKHRTVLWPTEILWSLKLWYLNPSMQMRVQSTAWASLPWNILSTTQTFSVVPHSFTAPTCLQAEQSQALTSLTRRPLKQKWFFFSFLVIYWYLTIILNTSGSSRGFSAFPQSQGISILKAPYSRANFGRTGLNMKTLLLQTHQDFFSKQCCTLQNCKLLLNFISFCAKPAQISTENKSF